MIKNKVLKLKKDTYLTNEIFLPKNQELEIVMDVIYINGHMVPPNMQDFFYGWIKNNNELFDDVTLNWK